MAAISVSKDMEALVDLFASPNFNPFEPKKQPILECGSSKMILECAVEEDEDQNSRVHDAAFTKRCGKILADLGDKFLQSYTPKENLPSTEPPLATTVEKLRSVFNKLAQIKETDPEGENDKAWSQFKKIMAEAVRDTTGVDVYGQLGAVLLTLHGLSNVASRVKGLVRVFFINYIREQRLDAQIQQRGGLNHLVDQDLD